jgi:hypothetical protein
MSKLKVKPDPECKYCGGCGEVSDWVPYGIGNTPLFSYCSCVEDQIPEDYDDDIELDLSEFETIHNER